MIVRNDAPDAVLTMEESRTGHYGEDDYYDAPTQRCPVCGAIDPLYFYIRRFDDECVGCTDCIKETPTL